MRGLIWVALLSTTALVIPSAATAGPVIAFVGGAANALGLGTVLGATATAAQIGAWSAGYFAAQSIAGSFLGRTLLSLGLSAAVTAMRGRPQASRPSAGLVNYAQPLTGMEWAAGRVRKGGPIGFSAESKAAISNPGGSDTRRKRFWTVILASHECDGVEELWCDKFVLTVNAAGWITSAPIWRGGSSVSDYIGRVRFHGGGSGQAVDPVLDAGFPEIGAGDDYAGLAYLACNGAHVSAENLQKIYPNGGSRWNVTAVLRGAVDIYDPRTDSYGWTNNLALIAASLATSYGLTVDWDEVGEEADACDVLLDNADGGTQPRWTFNGYGSWIEPWDQVRERLTLAGDVYWFERKDGKVGFKVGRWIAPTLTLTDRDFLAISIAEGQSGPDLPGQFVCEYTEPAYDWTEAVTGAHIEDAANSAREAVQAYDVHSHNQAWRIAYRVGRQAHAQYRVSATIRMIGYELMEGHRFVRVQLAETGHDFVMEIGKVIRNAGGMTFSIEGVSATAADFDPDGTTLEPDRPERTAVTEDDDIPAPATLAGEAIAATGGVAAIEWSWPTQSGDLAQDLRWRSTGGGVPEWQQIQVPPGQVAQVVSGLVDGASVEAQVRNRTAGNTVSDWAPATPVTVVAVANSEAPDALTAFAAAVTGSDVDLDITAPNDPLYRGTRFWRGSTATFGSATLIHTEYGAPATADNHTDAAPGSGTWYYWAAPINQSGIEGALDGPETVTIP